jgi:hypothetical protein
MPAASGRPGVAVQAEELGGFADAALAALKRPGDEDLLELLARVLVPHATIEHLLDERFELVAHCGYCSSRPDRSR